MRAKAILGTPESGLLGILRTVALIGVLAGAVGSVGFMRHAGRRNPSLLLMILFALWVLSPFMALLMANVFSPRWPAPTRAALYTVMLLLTLASLAIYGYVALGPPRPKPAFIFLVVPPSSCLLAAIVVRTAGLIPARQ